MKNNVAEARAQKGWTQVELADAVNVTTTCINAVEHGRYDHWAPVSPKCFRRSSEGRPKKAPLRSPGIFACFRSQENTNER